MSGLATNLSCGGPSAFLSLAGDGSTRQSATAATRIATSAGQRGLDRLGHLLGGLDIDAIDPRRRGKRHRPGDQGHARAGLGGGGGDGEALPARRAVGDHAHRIDRLVGRAGGDEDVLAGERHLPPSSPFELSQSDDRFRLGQAARAELAARHLAFVGLDDRRRHRP